MTANCVCPASVPTTGIGRPLTVWKAEQAGVSVEEMLARIGADYPLGRPVDEDDVVGAVEYFISDQASFLTGEALDADGGRVTRLPAVRDDLIQRAGRQSGPVGRA